MLDGTGPTKQAIIDIGKVIAGSQDPLQKEIGEAMQSHPRSWNLRLVRRITKHRDLPYLDEAIKKADST